MAQAYPGGNTRNAGVVRDGTVCLQEPSGGWWHAGAPRCADVARDDNDLEQDRSQCSAPPVAQRSLVYTAVRKSKAARSRWRFRMRAFHMGIKYSGAPPGLDHTAATFPTLPLAKSMGDWRHGGGW